MSKYNVARYERLNNSTTPTIANTPNDPEASSASQNQSSKPTNRFYVAKNTKFESYKQTFALCRQHILQWIVTVMLMFFVIITLKIYEKKGNITSSEKSTFQLIITALSIGLGLSFFAAFKDLAKVLRWRILAKKPHTVREIDLILGIDSLIKVIVLGWESRFKPWTLSICILWITLNLLAQTSVALINLTQSINDGSNWNDIYARPGKASVPDLTCYFNTGCSIHEEVSQGLANAYGQQTESSECGNYTETSQVLESQEDFRYYCRRTPRQQEFAYRFLETNPDDKQRIYPYFTNRIITASAGQCFKYREVSNKLEVISDIVTVWNYTFTNDSFTNNIQIPVSNEGFDGTTYIYRGTKIPQREIEWSCGDRCMLMWAHKNVGKYSSPAFYQCPITISTVSNSTNTAHNVSDNVARLAASAIALMGRKRASTKTWDQYQFYSFGSPWDIHTQEPDAVGANMAEFAIGSLSIMATKNPRILVDGTVPYLGSRLVVSWPYVIALLVSIAAVHLMLFALAIYTSRVVVVKDDSSLSIARLLRSLVEKTEDSGTVLTGKEISEVIQKRVAGRVVYWPQTDADTGAYSLDICKDVPFGEGLKNKRHPDGVYV